MRTLMLPPCLLLLAGGQSCAAADGLESLEQSAWRLGGSDAQREVIEDTRIAALLAADRGSGARDLLDRRLARRGSARDERWRRLAGTGTTDASL